MVLSKGFNTFFLIPDGSADKIDQKMLRELFAQNKRFRKLI